VFRIVYRNCLIVRVRRCLVCVGNSCAASRIGDTVKQKTCLTPGHNGIYKRCFSSSYWEAFLSSVSSLLISSPCSILWLLIVISLTRLQRRLVSSIHMPLSAAVREPPLHQTRPAPQRRQSLSRLSRLRLLWNRKWLVQAKMRSREVPGVSGINYVSLKLSLTIRSTHLSNSDRHCCYIDQVDTFLISMQV